ncbi:NAD-dependent histone deacetylase SIR2 [Cryomyces antarcticus]
MGQESSSPVDEATPPRTLQSRTLEGLAGYIRDGRAKRVVVMTGAGISTSAGIPDFRSPTTGLYANLARLNLPYAEAVFDISYFRQNPRPFYTLAHELYPGKYRPTITHCFIRLLHDKGLLLKLFTQNIDCLEREAGVPDDKIVEAHGSFARQSCIECKTPYPDDLIRKHIDEMAIPYCQRKSCGGLVKPEIVFFGEQLPAAFFANRGLPAEADLCIVLGTSLTVQPFASLPGFCEEGVPRLLINQEQVGSLGSRPDDVLLLGDCDDGVRKLAKACGWLEELEALWTKTAPKGAADLGKEAAPKRSREETIEDEVDKLTREVDQTLKLSEEHNNRVRREFGDSRASTNKPKKLEASLTPSPGESNSATTPKIEPEDGGKSEKDKDLSHVYPHFDKKSTL